jgi:hypothetical protein
MKTAAKALLVFGLALTLAGAVLTAKGVFVTPHQAVQIGVMRINGDTEQQNLQLPAVRNLISQSRYAFWGLVGIALGTALQILSALLD